MGKSVAAAALFLRYHPHVARLRYWKPVQTGIEQDDDTAVVGKLAGCRREQVLDEGVRLERPLSPHLAARLVDRPIRLPALSAIAGAQPLGDRWIVEGAGGVLVPLNESESIVDLIAALGLPVVVTARSSLGTINHTRLTLEALRTRALQVAGVVMVGPPDAENRKAIEAFGGIPVLGELPTLQPLTHETLSAWAGSQLDREGRLSRCFA